MTESNGYGLLVQLLRQNSAKSAGINRVQVATHDWDGVVQEAIRHGVAPLLYTRLKSGRAGCDVPSDVMEKLKEVFLYHGFKNTQRLHELSKVLSEFQQDGISSIVLKGGHLAELVYVNLAHRPMDDVDLLVKKDDLTSVEKKLLELGYVHPEHFKGGSKLSPHHLPSFRSPGGTAVLEVHWMIPPGEPLRIDMDGLWKRARSANIGGSEALVLSPEDLLLHLCVHASIHHRFGLGLRSFVDIGEVLRRYRDELDWNQFVARARQWHARNCVHLTLLVARDLIGAAVPGEILDEMRPEDFDERVVTWANEQIALQSSDLLNPSSLSPRIVQILGTGPRERRIVSLLRAVFPPLEEMALTYHVTAGSKRVLFFYPVRLKDIILSRSGAVWHLLRGGKATTVQADMYQKLIDDE